MKVSGILCVAALAAIAFCAPTTVRAQNFVLQSVTANDEPGQANDGSSGWLLSGYQGTAYADAPNTQADFVHSHAAALYTYNYAWDNVGPIPTWGNFHVSGHLSGNKNGGASATATVIGDGLGLSITAVADGLPAMGDYGNDGLLPPDGSGKIAAVVRGRAAALRDDHMSSATAKSITALAYLGWQ